MQAMSSSYDWRHYLPKSELKRIVSEDQIRELVYADSQLGQTMAQGPSVSADELVRQDYATWDTSIHYLRLDWDVFHRPGKPA